MWQRERGKRKISNGSAKDKVPQSTPLYPCSSKRRRTLGMVVKRYSEVKTQENMVRKSWVDEGGSEKLAEKNQEYTANHSTSFISSLETRN